MMHGEGGTSGKEISCWRRSGTFARSKSGHRAVVLEGALEEIMDRGPENIEEAVEIAPEEKQNLGHPQQCEQGRVRVL
jgi:hypothetical protein